MRSIMVCVFLGVCLAIAPQDIFSGGHVKTYFSASDQFADGLFEMQRTNVEVSVKQYNYIIVGFCADYLPIECSSRYRGLWPSM